MTRAERENGKVFGGVTVYPNQKGLYLWPVTDVQEIHPKVTPYRVKVRIKEGGIYCYDETGKMLPGGYKGYTRKWFCLNEWES